METNDYKTLMANMKSNFIMNMKKGDSKITDMNEGSIVMTIFEAIANIIEPAYIDTRLGFQSSLSSIPTSVFDFQKKSGMTATVQVYFSRAVALDTDVTIPKGTTVSDGTHKFTTSQTATIPSGQVNSNTVSAQARNVGIEYNVAAGDINTIESLVSSQVVAVTNPVKANGGANEETTTEMLSRFKKYINGLQGTNTYGLEAGLLAHDKVRSVSVVENEDGNSKYDVVIYVDDGTGSMTESLKLELLDLINGTGVSTNPGLRAAGINVDVQPCTQVSVDVAADITLYRVEESYADSALKDTIEKTINGLKVNEDVLFADVMTALKQTGSYVKNIKNLKLKGVLNSDVEISENQIARLGTVTFNYV